MNFDLETYTARDFLNGNHEMQKATPQRTQRSHKGVLTSSWSRPKNCSPDAHAGSAFFNGDFKIVRHAHRESCRANCRQISRGDGIAQLPQSAEMRARAFGIFRERRNGHKAANLK